MRYLFMINSTFGMGGPARVMTSWANDMSKDARSKLSLLAEDNKEFFYYTNDKVFKFSFNNKKVNNKFKLGFLLFLYNKIKIGNWKTDDYYVIINKYRHVKYAYLLRLLLKHFMNIKFIYWIHGGTSDLKNYYNSYNKLLISLTFDEIVALHDDYAHSKTFFKKSIKSKCIDYMLFDRSMKLLQNIHIIPNPIPQQIICCSTDLSERENVIITTGRLDPIKGYLYLIEAFKLAKPNLPGWKLKILGDGEQRFELESMVKSLDLEDDVLLPGAKVNVQLDLEKSKVFVSSSLEEGMPMSIIEAMGAGLATISTRTIGGEYLLENGKYGYLVPRENSASLALGLIELCSNEQKINELSKKAYQRAIDFEIETLRRRFESLFDG